MTSQGKAMTDRRVPKKRMTDGVKSMRDYRQALDQVMFEIEALRGTGNPRLALAEERLAS